LSAADDLPIVRQPELKETDMSTRKTNIQWGQSTVELAGDEVKAGQKAPDFTLTGNDMKPVTLKDTSGKVRIFSALPSLDTAVCDRETRRFNEEAAKLEGIEIWTVSMDLPFAQKRWCGAAGITAVKTASDYKKASFAQNWGVLEPERHLMVRAVFVVDKDDTVRYVEYVPSVGSEPNYDAVLSAAKALL
jgi:thioredoxin-dependent peroxiredoxin